MQITLTWQDNLTGQCGTWQGSLPLTIGRAPENTLQLTTDHISRHHARLTDAFGRVLLIDDRSKNGSYLNGRRVQAAVLHDGMHFTLGTVEFRCAFTPSYAAAALPHADCNTVDAHG